MKLRLIAVCLILSMAAWLPIMAQQSPAPQTTAQPVPPSGKPDRPAARCCRGKDASAQSLPCCEGKDAKDMPCYHRDAQDKQTASTCCDRKNGKTCCTKDATPSAANTATSNNKACGAAADHSCCHTKSKA